MERIAKLPLIYLLIIVCACEYQNEEALFGSNEDNCPTAVLFTNHIQPIVEANCAVSGCHAAGGISPELTSFEKVKAASLQVKHQTQSLQMPPPGSEKSLTQQEIDLISCWVKQGTARE